MKIELDNVWRIPALSEAGLTWEGRNELTRDRDARLAQWWPSAAAWESVIRLHEVLGRRVRVRFSRPRLDVAAVWAEPNPVIGKCEAIYTQLVDEFPQPFLAISAVAEVDIGRTSCRPYLITHDGLGTLIRVAELREVELMEPAKRTGENDLLS